jgi:ribose transport system substrate-binding protein
MKRSTILGFSLSVCLVLSFAVAAAAGPKVAFMLPNVGPWYNDKWEGFQDEAKKLGFEVTLYHVGGYANVAKQVAQVEDVTKAKYNAIVLHATSGTALIPPVKRALQAGLVVSTEHSPLAEPIVTNIWEGPAEAGRVSAMLIANWINGEGKVFLLMGPPGQMESLAEEEAFVFTMKRYFPKIQVFKENLTAESSTVMKVTEDLLTRHPDVKAIKAWGAMHHGTGAIKALQAANYKPGQVKVIASYSSPGDHDSMHQGWYQALFTGQAVEVGRESARITAKLLKKEKVPIEVNVPQVLIGPTIGDKWDKSGWSWGMK